MNALDFAVRFAGAVAAWSGLEILAIGRAWFGKRAEFKTGSGPMTAVLVFGQVLAGVAVCASGDGRGLVFCALGVYFTAVRFGGAFCGGADSMQLLVLTGLAGQAFFSQTHPLVAKGFLYWAVAHALLSYFVAGLVKARNPQWWDGQAIRLLPGLSQYGVPKHFARVLEIRAIAVALGWLVIGFEIAFPIGIVVIGPSSYWFLLIGIGLLFHFGNFMVLGLNRFFWAWSTAYPLLAFVFLPQLSTGG